MAVSREKMRELIDERARLVAEIERLKHNLEGLDRAITLLSKGNPGKEGLQAASRRSGLKNLVLDLLKEVGAEGLNAQKAVEMAAARGFTADRASVSSLLSRLKQDQIVNYNGDLYGLRDPNSGNESTPVVVSRIFRTLGRWPAPIKRSSRCAA
jgi:hypothetical protein